MILSLPSLKHVPANRWHGNATQRLQRHWGRKVDALADQVTDFCVEPAQFTPATHLIEPVVKVKISNGFFASLPHGPLSRSELPVSRFYIENHPPVLTMCQNGKTLLAVDQPERWSRID